MRKAILSIMFLVLIGCAAEEETSLLPPVITFEEDQLIYTTKINRSVEVAPSYQNAESASFAWRLEDGSLVGTAPALSFLPTQAGRYYITLRVTNSGGEAEREIRIDAFDLTPPIISLPGAAAGYKVLQGSELILSPTLTASALALGVDYLWKIEGEEVSRESVYTYATDEIGMAQVSLTTTNEDGSDEISFNVEVCAASEVDFSWEFPQTQYNLSQGRRIQLKPLDIQNAFEATYTWRVNDEEVQVSSAEAYIFSAEEQGDYTVSVTMQNQYLVASRRLVISVAPPEGTYRRDVSAGSTPACNKVYEFLPAPGQFVNEYYTVTTMDAACRYAEERMAQTAYLSLGSFGGYLVVGFDHSISNDGGYNIAITGNAFDGSSEPGIVWVMQDENGDGLPNDTWYELKGSEYGKPETWSNYAVTYYHPGAPALPVAWTDNHGGNGVIDHLGVFHQQAYYYPLWVDADRYTLRGTRLQARSFDQSGNGTYWVNQSFDWGYVDNFSAVDRLSDDDNHNAAPTDNHFKISHAVCFDGAPADLQYVDFVKIQGGVLMQCGWLGEVSTEVFGVKDYNLLKTKP